MTRRKLNAYLDGELSPHRARALRLHLNACHRCGAAAGELERLNRVLDELAGVSAPAGFARRVRQAAREGRVEFIRPARFGGVPFNGALTRAAAVLMLAAGVWVGLAMGGSMPRPARAATAPEAAESEEYDLAVDLLSPAPVGSVADDYLAFLGESD